MTSTEIPVHPDRVTSIEKPETASKSRSVADRPAVLGVVDSHRGPASTDEPAGETPADKTELERAKDVRGGLHGLKSAVRAYRETEQEVARLQEAGTPEDEPPATDERRDESGSVDPDGEDLSSLFFKT